MTIEVHDLSKVYGKTLAVDHLSFTVQPGMVTGFLGPNGAGKSTTMRMILGLDRPTSGSALIDGKPYHDLHDPLTQVGSLLDASWVHPNRSARAHLAWMARSNGLPASRVGEVLELVGLQVPTGPAEPPGAKDLAARHQRARALLERAIPDLRSSPATSELLTEHFRERADRFPFTLRREGPDADAT